MTVLALRLFKPCDLLGRELVGKVTPGLGGVVGVILMLSNSFIVRHAPGLLPPSPGPFRIVREVLICCSAAFAAPRVSRRCHSCANAADHNRGRARTLTGGFRCSAAKYGLGEDVSDGRARTPPDTLQRT